MNNKQKGFTLIELLVVIAIIGILASLVLVALGNARSKANDARIKSSIGQLRTIAEIMYDAIGAAYQNPGNTAGIAGCFTAGGANDTTCTSTELSTSVINLLNDIDTANGANGGELTASSTASGFCVQAELNQGTAGTDNGDYICVDGTGATRVLGTSMCTALTDVSCN